MGTPRCDLGLAGNKTAVTTARMFRSCSAMTCSGDKGVAHRMPPTELQRTRGTGQLHAFVGARIWPRRRQGCAFTSPKNHGDTLHLQTTTTPAAHGVRVAKAGTLDVVRALWTLLRH